MSPYVRYALRVMRYASCVFCESIYMYVYAERVKLRSHAYGI